MNRGPHLSFVCTLNSSSPSGAANKPLYSAGLHNENIFKIYIYIYTKIYKIPLLKGLP